MIKDETEKKNISLVKEKKRAKLDESPKSKLIN